ncbi:MAG: membrane protein insertion efficiency factor YidD [Bdellovibrionia bacterium]
MLGRLLKALFFFYRAYVSPFFHQATRLITGPGLGCRFEPTCSAYADQAFQTHGFITGAYLTLKRLARCHPFAQAGYDPVPEARSLRCQKE